jgi:hypothetical protein
VLARITGQSLCCDRGFSRWRAYLSVRLSDPQKSGIMWGGRLAFSLPAKHVTGWLAIAFSVALALMASPAALADELQDYAQQCDDAIGASATVRDFNCDDGTEVPGQGSAPFAAKGRCDQPNRLDKRCDPGSRFQVLTRTDDAYVVAHCRKKGNRDGEYGDIAVIQYSRKTEPPVSIKPSGMVSQPR